MSHQLSTPPQKCHHFFFFLLYPHLTPAKLLPFAPPNHTNFFFFFLYSKYRISNLLESAPVFFLRSSGFLLSHRGIRLNFLLELLRRRLRRKGVARKPPSSFTYCSRDSGKRIPGRHFFPRSDVSCQSRDPPKTCSHICHRGRL